MNARLFLFLFFVLFPTGCSFTHNYSHPSDAELARFFHEQKEDFNRLVEMFAEDSKGKNPTAYWIGREKEHSWTLENFSGERKAKYLELMNKLDVKTVGRVSEQPEIITLTVTRDFGVSENGENESDAKGYAYSLQTPSRVKSFGETDLWGSCYKEIKDNWYIFHQTLSGHGE